MFGRFSLASFAAGTALGIILAAVWFLGAPMLPAPAPAQTDTATSTLSSGLPPATPSGAIAVADQPAGDSVLIESVTVPPPGVWVAVREISDAALGNVLGAARAGTPRSNFSVPLLRATEPGETYAVELYRDDGNGAFDLANDSVYVDFDTGQRVVAYFKTTE